MLPCPHAPVLLSRQKLSPRQAPPPPAWRERNRREAWQEWQLHGGKPSQLSQTLPMTCQGWWGVGVWESLEW